MIISDSLWRSIRDEMVEDAVSKIPEVRGRRLSEILREALGETWRSCGDGDADGVAIEALVALVVPVEKVVLIEGGKVEEVDPDAFHAAHRAYHEARRQAVEQAEAKANDFCRQLEGGA